jgi:hypothetical protein
MATSRTSCSTAGIRRDWLASGPRSPRTTKSQPYDDAEIERLRQLGVDDPEERLRALGATVLPEQPNDTLIVLADPEGNEFCLLR